MSINATEGVGAAGGLYVPAGGPSATAGAEGDKQMFLELLVAQLRYQDPLKPTDSAQFLAQTAQFNALEKMQDVADQTSALLSAQVSFGAAGLVGKDVTYLDAAGVEQTGQVSGVRFGPEGPTLDVGGTSVALAAVQTIVGAAPAAPAAPTSPTAPAVSADPTSASA